MNNTASLSSLIWSSADDVLRGIFKPSEYGRVLLPFVVMRRLDCVLEPKKDKAYNLYEQYKGTISDPSKIINNQLELKFFNISKFDLSRLKSDPKNVAINFNNYIQGYSKNVRDIIKNFTIKPLVEKLHNNNRLYLLIDKLTEVDLHPNKIDNHQMGLVYEELLRKFSEMSNETSGDHYTPRDVVKLLVALVFGGDKQDLQGEGKIRSVFDPCCGTGGMLTIGKSWVLENINPELKIVLYGQELNDVTYSICKSDLLMLEEEAENIHGPISSISNDCHEGCKFDYMITNPPFGVSWKKSEAKFVEEEAKEPDGRFFAGTPRTSDGSFLFLQHLIDKMKPEGSRIGIVFNGSPLFTGDAGSGESEIRKWIIENDWLECIVSLPDRMFFNTGITTYIWIVTNKKSTDRQGKVQLIDGSSFGTPMKKNLGDKGKYISDTQRQQLFDIYQNNQASEYCKIFDNNFFGYTKCQILRINRPAVRFSDKKIEELRYSKQSADILSVSREIYNKYGDDIYNEDFFTQLKIDEIRIMWEEQTRDSEGKTKNFPKGLYNHSGWISRLQKITLARAIQAKFGTEKLYLDFNKLHEEVKSYLKTVNIKATGLKDILSVLSDYNPEAEKIVKEITEYAEDRAFGYFNSDKQGKYNIYEFDPKFSDSERVPLQVDLAKYFTREVKPHLPESWMNRDKDKIGYEINFTKYFYKFTPLRSLEDISQDLKTLDAEINKLSLEMVDE